MHGKKNNNKKYALKPIKYARKTAQEPNEKTHTCTNRRTVFQEKNSGHATTCLRLENRIDTRGIKHFFIRTRQAVRSVRDMSTTTATNFNRLE